jgi:predicted peptidase
MRTTSALLAAVFTAAALHAQDAMPKHQTAQHLAKKITKSVECQYLQFLPDAAAADSTNRWPLIVFLHGAGERGTNLSKVAVHGPPKVVKTRPDFPFIVVSPQCPSGQIWSVDVLLTLLDEVSAKLPVDTNRIYLTGLSMGGYGTWKLALQYPERFAAAAPICGGGEPIDAFLAGRGKASALKSLGVWAFHGAKDPVVKLEESERMVSALKAVGCADVKLTVYPEAQHDSWTETYDNPELYDWFLRHRR